MVEVYQFRVYLREISPAIWRRLLLRSDQTIADLHHTLQIAMGWSDLHLNRFLIHGKDFGVYHIGGMSFSDDPHTVKLSDFHFHPHERFLYEYDFGDRWEHEIRLEKKLPLDTNQTYPVCIGGARQSPPEDCGGPMAFQALKSHYSVFYIADKLWEIIEYDLRDEYWEELHEFMYWLSVNQFDRRAVNKRLHQYATGDDE
ncbi:MAG: plasmid pRiA4b ORF-3 family protein [Anaerolineae bacterium]|nr:plasmid pRiA4b ORF-3 family protein [Anaerolineae bacterium]